MFEASSLYYSPHGYIKILGRVCKSLVKERRTGHVLPPLSRVEMGKDRGGAMGKQRDDPVPTAGRGGDGWDGERSENGSSGRGRQKEIHENENEERHREE